MSIYSKTRTRLSNTDRLEYEKQETIYNGQVVSLAHAIAMRARDNRKKKEQEQRKQKNKRIFQKTEVFPEILLLMEKTYKARTLKSFTAFINNGSVIWAKDYKSLSAIYPKFNTHFILYRAQYRKITETVKTLKDMLKRNKCHRSFIGVAETFGYQMMELIDYLTNLIDFITKNNILSNPCFINKEIIIGSTDGRRLGLRQIIQASTSSITKTRENLITLQRELITAYDSVFSHSYI